MSDHESVKLTLIPQIDAGEFPLHLSSPAAINCGGYLLPSNEKIVYAYSPIDTVVAAVEAKIRGLIVTDLFQFFKKYPIRISETELILGIEIDGIFSLYTIISWKYRMQFSSMLLQVLRKNAPLTFNY